MNFNFMVKMFLVGLFTFVAACSDVDDEANLVNLHAVASQDVISINFPEATETTVSISSEVKFTLQGLKSNGIDTVTIEQDVEWSLSAGAVSTINQLGLFTAAETSEDIILTATFGFLSESIDIKVSSAKFDQVVKLDEDDSGFSINMCQSQSLVPVGLYVDENGDEEIRPVDSTIINTIDWIVTNEEDGSVSQRAYIETATDNQIFIHTFASGNIIVQAKAVSLLTGEEVTSVDFNQTIENGLNSIKLCDSSDIDLSNCAVTDPEVEKDQFISLIAVADYQAADGSNYFENISRNSKWGISDSLNASSVFSSDRQQLDITGEVEDSSITVSVACGNIEQAVDDILPGVILETLVSCGANVECQQASQQIEITNLSVLSFDVTANDIDLTDDVSISLSSRPAEITLFVTANFSNGDSDIITDDNLLDYTIIPIDGQSDVIETITDSPGVFTVLAAGTAKIKLFFRGETFYVVIEIP
ncbi:MAG: hypothetical protein HOM14_04350 [Gammaproteobacteria bacterium]|jgi:hypothetical protein|nr:hypothetical protein [Gammaproteobacteria bacterium]MBT3722107.1 hypothetical protein [Gammaproteobacteria bacterium]MBT4860578.1 hypothetical protein [Gammaproteobacteria bacterium]MBT6550568.1 hypothetical protein [Gammaproteobacteria bacterium]MBT7047690.1 hypothetical protein [Gammaproteobacteria bacterium]